MPINQMRPLGYHHLAPSTLLHSRSFATSSTTLPIVLLQRRLQRPASLRTTPFVFPRRCTATSSAPPAKPATLLTKLQPYIHLSRLHAPRGSLLLFLPCSWSIALSCTSASLPPSVLFGQTLLFLTGAVVMRGAGCTINDMWDRKYDAMVERTKTRPLASGAISTRGALGWLALQMGVGLAVLLQLNWYSIVLGASSLALVFTYPLMKRITYWPQAFLGLTFSWGALLGSSAVLGHVDLPVCLPLYLSSIIWVIHYDTIYAHQDADDDVHAGVKSTALLFGSEWTKPALSVFSTGFIGLLAYSGYANGAGLPFYSVACAGAAAHLAWQIKQVDLASRASCWYFFGSNVVTGTIVWAGCFLDYCARVLLA